MAFDGDPFRILGLARGATLDEVKRAYRRLAKANHPDAAGSGALSRFLAIQAAYEQLVEGQGATGGKAGGSADSARRASEADPDRADATRRAYGGRPRARRPAGAPPGRARPDAGRASRERPTEGGQADDAAQADPQSARRRGKATLGSTSYDDANSGPFEPNWSGASWYGTTSGTYWTINPKEYADPRKHGPEYQARARRAAGAKPDSLRDDVAAEPTGTHASAPGPGATAESATGEPATGEPATGEPATAEPAAARDPTSAPVRPSGATREPSSWWQSTSGPSESAESTPGDAAWHPLDEPSPPDRDVPDPARALANLARALTDPRTGGRRGRVIRAFVGWLPIALGIGWALGEVTGCGRFAATCDPAVDPLILLIQGGALVALLLAPVLASLAAGAALGLLVAAVAATVVLSVTGTAGDEGSRRATLGLLLVVAWLAGLAIAAVLRVRAASSWVRPVS